MPCRIQVFFLVFFSFILAISSTDTVFGYADEDVEILVSVDKPSYKEGDLLTIKGTGAHSYTVVVKIVSPTGEQIADLKFIAASSGDFSTVWIVPRGLDEGTYTIQISDVKKQARTTFNIGTITQLQNSAQSQSVTTQIPDWVRNNAEWWSEGKIADEDFVSGIEFMIRNGIIQFPPTYNQDRDESVNIIVTIPNWVRTSAGWWADGLIEDDSFVLGLTYLIENRIIVL